MQDLDREAALAALQGEREEDRRAGFDALHAELKALVRAGRSAEAAALLRSVALPTLDYSQATALCRIQEKLAAGGAPASPLRLAVLASFTATQLCRLVRLFAAAFDVELEIYEADYGTLRQEVLDPGSELYAFRPDLVYLATSRRDLAHVPALGDDRAAVQEHVAREVADWSLLWRTLRERAGCAVIQNNFDPPPWRALGNHELRMPGGLARYVALVNLALADAAPAWVTLHDVEALAASRGTALFGDERFYHHAKLPCAPECLADYAHSVASLLGALRGKGRKCLVLDLDNTLWGGVVGDDGLGGIRLGQGTADGEAFLAFQRWCKALRERGVILAVCSKNDDANAREPFEKHTEMVLRLDDVSCFVANWDDKATNLRAIAKRLDIGIDSLVFADDNPAERALVRQLAPEVAVPELPEDVAGYIAAIERHRYFQPVSISSEDLRRTDFYRANAARAEAETSTGDLGEFLRSLAMVARLEPVREANLERVAQLVMRSNQFNLTTRRHSSASLGAMSRDGKWLTRALSLADRFGDNGLVSVLLARVEDDALEIDTWLMSCRVLKRGVETFLLGHLHRWASERGIRTIRGEYLPTAKNRIVRDHYAGLGFAKVAEDAAGATRWELAVTAETRPAETSIEELFENG